MQFSINKKVVDSLYSYLTCFVFSQPFDKFFVNIKFVKKRFNTKIDKIIRISIMLKNVIEVNYLIMKFFIRGIPIRSNTFISFTLGLSLVRAFLYHFKKKSLSECPAEIFDDIFVTFVSYTQFLKSVDYMNLQHFNMKYTFEV